MSKKQSLLQHPGLYFCTTINVLIFSLGFLLLSCCQLQYKDCIKKKHFLTETWQNKHVKFHSLNLSDSAALQRSTLWLDCNEKNFSTVFNLEKPNDF